jgi:FkbM family methyltransferase
MTFSTVAKRLINRLMSPTGLAIVRQGRSDSAPTFEGALERLRARRISIRSVIDIGASDGSWSRSMMSVYSDADYLLIEANPIHQNALDDFCRRHSRAQYAMAAAAAEKSTVFFDSSDALGGAAASAQLDDRFVQVASTTVDSEVAERLLEPPFLLKLDTHGFEAQILEGASESLKETEVLIIECYNFEIADGSLLFDQMCRYLREKGFRCLDLFDILYRSSDLAFWQADFLFVRSDRAEFSSRMFA